MKVCRETQISKTKCIEICKSNNPAQRRVMRPKLQKQCVRKLVGRIILPMHGYNTPPLGAELGSSTDSNQDCPTVHTRDRKIKQILNLLLTVFVVCLFNTAIAAEKPAPVEPVDVKSPTTITPTVVSSSGNISRGTIGCVLPLSGKYAEIGKKASDAIMLSAKIMNGRIKGAGEVVVEDSQGLPDKTKEAVAKLANNKNVMAIICINEKENASDVAMEANKRGVPIILITSKEGVTLAGEYVFQHFLTPSQEIKALVKYALNYLNCAIFSVLYPEDEYGKEMLSVFIKEVKTVGGKVEKAIPFSANQTDFAGEINTLTGTAVKSPSKTDREDKPGIAALDFEALFIPDYYWRAKIITSQLDFYNVKGFPLLSTSLWNVPNLLKDGAEYMDGAVFADSFSKDGFYPETYNFVDLYYTVYKRPPENIEALAFDTAGMIFNILENEKIKTRQDFTKGLLNMANYNGATGSIYFDANRVAQKTPFILKVKKEKFEQVK